MVKYVDNYDYDDEMNDGCSQCDHICDSSEWCKEHCGPEHDWKGYEKTEIS